MKWIVCHSDSFSFQPTRYLVDLTQRQTVTNNSAFLSGQLTSNKARSSSSTRSMLFRVAKSSTGSMFLSFKLSVLKLSSLDSCRTNRESELASRHRKTTWYTMGKSKYIFLNADWLKRENCPLPAPLYLRKAVILCLIIRNKNTVTLQITMSIIVEARTIIHDCMLLHHPHDGFARGRPPVPVPYCKLTRSAWHPLQRLRTSFTLTQNTPNISRRSDILSCFSRGMEKNAVEDA